MKHVMLIESIFTFQGEGPDVGKPMQLLRFKRCNNSCPWCDTQVKMRVFQESEHSLRSIQEVINDKNCGMLITGGEPTFNLNLNQTISLINEVTAPLYNVEYVYLGEHLSELNMKMEGINRKRSPGVNLRNNLIPRYHFLEFPENIPIVTSIIDFKHYFSVNVKYLHKIKKTNFICSVSSLFRESISQRFAYFLSRIGLPEIQS